MAEHNYAYIHNQQELCPALYVKLSMPIDKTLIAKDIHAYLDTGSPLTAIPITFKPADFNIFPNRYTTVVWGGITDNYVPVYPVLITAEEYKPRLIEIIFDRVHDYGIIGRNLMNYWYLTLKGPESCFSLKEC